MKLTEKAKRYLLVLGGILLCAGLLVAIWFQLKPEAVPEERFEAETGEVTEITVDMEQEEEKGQGAQNGDGIVEVLSPLSHHRFAPLALFLPPVPYPPLSL